MLPPQTSGSRKRRDAEDVIPYKASLNSVGDDLPGVPKITDHHRKVRDSPRSTKKKEGCFINSNPMLIFLAEKYRFDMLEQQRGCAIIMM